MSTLTKDARPSADASIKLTGRRISGAFKDAGAALTSSAVPARSISGPAHVQSPSSGPGNAQNTAPTVHAASVCRNNRLNSEAASPTPPPPPQEPVPPKLIYNADLDI